MTTTTTHDLGDNGPRLPEGDPVADFLLTMACRAGAHRSCGGLSLRTWDGHDFKCRCHCHGMEDRA